MRTTPRVPVEHANAFNAPAEHSSFQDLASLRAFGRKLISQWESAQQGTLNFRAEYAPAAGLFIWAGTHHTVQLVKGVLQLSENNQMIIAAPLIRVAVETAMHNVLALLDPAHARSVTHEGLRQRRAAYEDVLALGIAGFDPKDIAALEQSQSHLLADATGEGRHFKQLCQRIRGGMEVYLVWRALSAYSHAGMALTDFYLEDGGSDQGVSLNPHAAILNQHEAMLGTAISMMISSIKAFTIAEESGRLSRQIERAQKRMGYHPVFELRPQGNATTA